MNRISRAFFGGAALSMAVAGPAVAVPGGSTPPYQPPAPLADVGATVPRPFGLYCGGQSNARGQSYDGSTTVLPGIYIANAVSSPTAIVPAAYGSAPLNGTTPNTSSTTTDPTLSYKNQCVSFANRLRSSGRIPASRPIVIIPNWYPGQSITGWVGSTPGSFTAGSFFTDLQAELAVATAAYPGFKIDFAVWDQGEADNSGTYGSQALYTAAFQALLAQFRGLPQWSVAANGDAFDTNLTMVELARFADNTLFGRNDAIDSFANGAIDPHVTVTPTFGATETPIAANVGPHYSGASLTGIIADRDFAAWVQGSLGGSYRPNSPAFAPLAQIAVANAALSVSPDQLKAGATITATQASGGVVVLPDAGTVPSGTMVPVYIPSGFSLGFSCVTTTPCAGGVTTDNAAASTSPSLASANGLLFSLGNRWFLTTLGPKTGGFNFRVTSYTAGVSGTPVAVALDTNQTRGAIGYASYNTITLTTPQAGQWYQVLGNPAGGASSLVTSDGSATIEAPGGKLVSSYPVLPGEMVALESIGNRWLVMSDNLQAGGSLTLPKLAAAPTTAPGAGYGLVFMIAGTNSGTCKLQMIAGTSTTPVTIADNVGSGC